MDQDDNRVMENEGDELEHIPEQPQPDNQNGDIQLDDEMVIVEENGIAENPEEMNEVDEQDDDNFEPVNLAELVLAGRELEIDDEDDENSNEFEDDQSQHNSEDGEAQQPYELLLPSRHQYLGDTEELTGRTVVEENDFITIPVLLPSIANNLVLLPSQTLPLTIFRPMQQSMLRNVIAKDRIIGIIHTHIALNELNENSRFVQYGTTAEIYEYHSDESGHSLSVKAKGRQRFRVISTHRETTGCIVAKVKILPDIRMSDPLYHVRLQTHQRMNMPKYFKETGQKLQVREVGSLRSTSAWRARRQTAMLTPWPSWVYDLYDADQLALRLVNDIVTYFSMKEGTLKIPRDPQELSHWAAINLPLSDSHRLALLSLDTATQRLRYILSITARSGKALFCIICGKPIADASNIFCMSIDGPQGTFVNPGGYVHEMITVTQVTGIIFQGKASTQHSWFPGYAWKIASCSTCHNHVGWSFQTKKCMKPSKFYGITRKSVKTKIIDDADPRHYII